MEAGELGVQVQKSCGYVQYRKFRKLVKKKASLGKAVAPVSRSPSSSFSQAAAADAFDEGLAFWRWCPREVVVDSGVSMNAPGLEGDVDNVLVLDGLVETVSAVALFCKGHARNVVRRRFGAGVCKPLVHLGMMRAPRGSSMKEGSRLVSYAAFNALAIRRIEIKLAQGQLTESSASTAVQAVRTKLSSLHAEILQSPLLVELIAAYVDHETISESAWQGSSRKPLPQGFQEFACNFDGAKPTLSCVTLDSFRLDFELVCSICLDTFFCPVALSCGHIFCYSCACSTASVPASQGLHLAKRNAKCPLCRQTGVYQDSADLPELSGLIKHRCKSYWRERSQRERAQQLQEIKEFYNQELRAAMGYTNN